MKVNWNQLKSIKSKLKSIESKLKSIESKLKTIQSKLKSNKSKLKSIKSNKKSIESKLKVNWNPFVSWLIKKMLGGGKKSASYRVSWNCLGGPHTNQQQTLIP